MSFARIRDMKHLPFSVFKRTGRRFYSVKFKNEKTGKYLPAISTRQETEAAAITMAFQMAKRRYTPERRNDTRQKVYLAGHGKRGGIDGGR
jgi:hypothetical protein